MIVIYLKLVNKKTFLLFFFFLFFFDTFHLKRKNKIKHQLKISLNVYLAGNQILVLLNTKNVSYYHGLYYYYNQKSLFIFQIESMLVVKRSTPTDDYNIKAVNFFLKKYEFYVIILEEKLLSKKHLSS